MNVVMISGYVLENDKAIYRKVEGSDIYEYYFLVYVHEPFTKTNSKIPVRASGDMANQCYASLCTDSYVEITGGLVRLNDDKSFYIQVKDLVYRRPKSKRVYQLTSSEFIETFAPSKLIERLVANSGTSEKN